MDDYPSKHRFWRDFPLAHRAPPRHRFGLALRQKESLTSSVSKRTAVVVYRQLNLSPADALKRVHAAKIDDDSFGFFSDEALRTLILISGQRASDAAKAVALYAIGEFAKRRVPVMSHNLVNHLHEMYVASRRWQIELHRHGGSMQQYRLGEVIL